MSKPVDLKCEETLRDSPPPDLVYPPALVPPTTTQIQSSTTTSGAVVDLPGAGSTFNIFVRRFDPQTAEPYQRNSPLSTSTVRPPESHVNVPQTVKSATKLESPKPQSAYISQFFPNSNVLYTPVTKLLQHNPQIFSPIFPTGSYPLDQSYQPLVKNVSPVKLPSAEVSEHSSISSSLFRESNSTLAAGSKQSNVAKVISLPAVIPRSQQQKSSQMGVSDAQTSSSARPVTLHINTGKGTAVVQLQQSAAISPSSTKQVSITPKRDQPQQIVSPTVINPGRPTSMVAAPSSVISSVPSYSSRIFPSPISLPPTAPAAYIYQDHMTAFQTLASMQNMNAKFNPSPVTMHQPSSIPFIVGTGGTARPLATNLHDPHFLSQTRLGISPMKPLSSPAGFSSSPTTPASASQNVHGNNGSSTVAGTPGQSPRPSILRKRPSELGAMSSVSKKLTYESLATTPRKLTDVPSSLAVDEVVISTTRGPEHPDAGNSNHSSSASTVSAGSALDGHSNSSYPDNATNRSLSPSPRKRPRKQCLDDLPEGGGGGDLDSEDGRLSTETLVAAEQHGEYSEPKLNADGSAIKPDFVEPSIKFKSVKIEMNDADEYTKVPRRPRPSLWSSCETTWQPRRNHFLHYDDVKPKEEKKPTAAEICNNKQIWQKIEGWRLHMISMHMDDLDKCEQTNLDDLDLILRTFDAPKADDGLDHVDLDFMKEMVMTSVQRCKAVREQLNELKKPLCGILKHKRNVETLVQKFSAKRPLRKKEKTDL